MGDHRDSPQPWTLYRWGSTHGLQTPREEIAFTARPKIHSHSQIFRYGGSIFCLPHRPNFSDIFDLCLHWVSVLRDHYVIPCKTPPYSHLCQHICTTYSNSNHLILFGCGVFFKSHQILLRVLDKSEITDENTPVWKRVTKESNTQFSSSTHPGLFSLIILGLQTRHQYSVAY